MRLRGAGTHDLGGIALADQRESLCFEQRVDHLHGFIATHRPGRDAGNGALHILAIHDRLTGQICEVEQDRADVRVLEL